MALRSVLLGLAVVVVSASPPTVLAEPPVNTPDRRFMDEAAAGGMVEIVLGRVAEEKATNDGVRRFGARMVEDHNKANEALKQIAAAKGVALPTGLTAEQKAMVSQMKKRKSGFDQAYVTRMVDDHRRMVALFERAVASAGDADVKSFATGQLPVLRSHLEMAQQAGAGLVAAAPTKAGAKLPVKPVTRE